MNELNINILRSPAKSVVRRFLGILYVIMGVLWLITRIILKDPEPSRFPLPFLDIVYIVLFGFTGIIFIIEGSGISIGRWFGEAYIRIDSTGIFVKKSVFSREWSLLWKEIEQVEFSVIKIKFSLSGNSLSELDYDNLEYEHIQELKKSIRAIADEKNIRVISHS